MAVVSSSPFTILCDWTGNMLADAHRGFGSIAARLSRIAGQSTNCVIIWAKTAHGSIESGYVTVMDHAGSTHVSPNASGLVAFLKQLPASVRRELVEGLKE